jgi:hypothetical protein
MTSADLTQRASDVEGKTACDQTSFEFEMAYQMRVACDKIRFAISVLDTIFPGKVTDISAHLLEALDRLQRTDQRFQNAWKQRRTRARGCPEAMWR